MITGVALRQSPIGWEFVSEAALEKFVWENLQELLGIQPLKRQHVSKGEIADILAVDNDGGLIVLELKNTEDRYLIQQLTRYYANLIEEKPFIEMVNYEHPIRLVAISPIYHRHNLVDQKYSNLQFELLKFSVVQENDKFHFNLLDLESSILQKYQIPYTAVSTAVIESVVETPQLLLSWLGGCSSEEQAGFLKIRNKILSCSSKIKELADKKAIQYGAGKAKLCAEICFHQKTQRPVLFLWLPTPATYNVPVWKADAPTEIAYVKKPVIGRLRIWTNGQTITHIGHVPEGFGTMKLQAEWDQLPLNKRQGLRQSLSSRSHIPPSIDWYARSLKDAEKPDYWEFLADLAIETWLARNKG